MRSDGPDSQNGTCKNGQPLSLRETGKVLGLSGERVRLIEREALRKLRDSNLISTAAVL